MYTVIILCMFIGIIRINRTLRNGSEGADIEFQSELKFTSNLD